MFRGDAVFQIQKKVGVVQHVRTFHWRTRPSTPASVVSDGRTRVTKINLNQFPSDCFLWDSSINPVTEKTRSSFLMFTFDWQVKWQTRSGSALRFLTAVATCVERREVDWTVTTPVTCESWERRNVIYIIIIIITVLLLFTCLQSVASPLNPTNFSTYMSLKEIITCLNTLLFSLCHPGPCPQCPASVTKSCVCGKTRYVTFWFYCDSQFGYISLLLWVLTCCYQLISFQSTDALRPGHRAPVCRRVQCFTQLCTTYLLPGVPQRSVSALPAAGSAG